MSNERITEEIIRDHFKNDPLFSMIKLEEQKASSKKIGELLDGASKSGTGMGRPEFLITFPSQNSKYLIVVECKYNESDHSSRTGMEDTAKYAVDGVLHYAKFLSKEYDVIAIAVSGKDKDCRVSTFHRPAWADTYEDKTTNTLLPINDYLKLFQNETFAEGLKNVDIIQKAIYLNNEFQACSIAEYMRCTMVSAILMGLLSDGFKAAYRLKTTSKDLGKSLIAAIEEVLGDDKVRNADSMINEYKKILNEPLFTHDIIQKKREQTKTIEILKEIISYIQDNVLPLMSMDESGMDVLGKFYTEFVRYAGGSGKVGLVLTPSHVVDFFCDLADISTESVVYDPCTGSGGFLVAAMKNMLAKTENETIKKGIREHQLIGVEARGDMFTYACSNMMFRGDGRSNIYHGDCFQREGEIVNNHDATVAFLNPPYDVGPAGQMEFVQHALKVVSKSHGTVVAIVQMSCAIKNEKQLIAVKEKLLEQHTLKAVISMPDELFNPAASVPTCIMVREAGRPNIDNQTWFGYLKDDGFEKRKHKGRIDIKNKRNDIRKQFVTAYKNRNTMPGLAIKKEVTAQDERLAEAYMETSYQDINDIIFKQKISDFLSFNVKNISLNYLFDYIDDQKQGFHKKNKNDNLDTQNRKSFRYDEIFDIKKGYYNKKPYHTEQGNIPFIGATDGNNGVTNYFTLQEIEETNKAEGSKHDELEKKIFPGNCITVSNNGSVGYAFYQEKEFTCTHDVNPLYLLTHKLNKYIAFFLITLIEQEQYRRNYGRKRRPSRMPDSIIKLPVTKDGSPDRAYMEDYIKSLPYSASI